MMSKKIFSAQDWENVPSEIQQAHTPSIAPIYNKVEDDVESVVREIEQCAIDIAPHYKDWVELGFALVDGFAVPAVVDGVDRKSTRLNSSHPTTSRMPSSA